MCRYANVPIKKTPVPTEFLHFTLAYRHINLLAYYYNVYETRKNGSLRATARHSG